MCWLKITWIVIVNVHLFLFCIKKLISFLIHSPREGRQNFQIYRFTKSNLNTVLRSLTFSDMLSKRLIFFGEKRKKNASWKSAESHKMAFFWFTEMMMMEMLRTVWNHMALTCIKRRNYLKVNFTVKGLINVTIYLAICLKTGNRFYTLHT